MEFLSPPLAGTLVGWCAFAAFLSFAIPAVRSARREQEPILPAVFTPVGFGMIAWVMLASMLSTLRRGGVQWRGRLYPLAELRARRVH